MRPLFAFLLLPALAVSAEVASSPFELHKNTVFVKAYIGNSELLDVALDSGSGHTSLDEEIAKKLGMDLSFKALSSGASGKQQISLVEHVKVRFAGVEYTEPRLVVYPLDFLSKRLGRRVDAIIGVELFHKYVVEMDYPSRQVRLHVPENYAYLGSGSRIPVTFVERMPVVDGALTGFGGSAVPAKLQIDTGGARAGAMMWKHFVDEKKLFEGAREMTELPITGFGGTTMQKHARIQSMTIGAIHIDQPLIGLIDYMPKSVRYDGLLGSGFLKEFKVIFDLPHNGIILERPSKL